MPKAIARISFLLFLVVAGAIANFVVAWGCALCSPLTDGSSAEASAEDAALWKSLNESLSSPTEDVSFRSLEERTSLPLGRIVLFAMRSDGLGYDAHMLSNVDFLPTARVRWHEDAVAIIRAGWPWRCLAGERWDRESGWDGYAPKPVMSRKPTGAISAAVREVDAITVIRPDALGGKAYRVLPYRPTWPGFLANSIFYAAIIWLLFATPGKVRRMIRFRRGLCPKCAYPIGASSRCSECGATVSR